MKYLFNISIILLFCNACSDDDVGLPDNQIGTWEGTRTAHIYQDSTTISNDTFPMMIILRADGTGVFNSEEIIDWYKEQNESSSRDVIKIESTTSIGTVVRFYPVYIDEFNYQEWASSGFFPASGNRINEKWSLNRVE